MTKNKKDDVAAVRIFPPAVPLVTILAGIGLDRLWRIGPGSALLLPERYWIGGLIVIGSIFGLGLWSVLAIRRTGQTENPWRPTTEIVESGPFRFSRNPMYLQMILVCLGMAVMLMNVWILLLTPLCAWILYKLAILPEEAYLESKFGEIYRAYMRRVRRWL